MHRPLKVACCAAIAVASRGRGTSAQRETAVSREPTGNGGRRRTAGARHPRSDRRPVQSPSPSCVPRRRARPSLDTDCHFASSHNTVRRLHSSQPHSHHTGAILDTKTPEPIRNVLARALAYALNASLRPTLASMCRHPVVGPFLDLWNYDLSHWDLALALTLLYRAPSLYEPLVIVSESAQVSTLLALGGPASIRRIPGFGEPPTQDELDAVQVGWRSWADASWWTAQGRIVIAQYAPGRYALLAMVGHGGSVKYDPPLKRRRPTYPCCRAEQRLLTAVGRSKRSRMEASVATTTASSSVHASRLSGRPSSSDFFSTTPS